MRKTHITSIYYPTTCVLVDDNKIFLKQMKLKLLEQTLCRTFSDPIEALNFIQTSAESNFSLKNIITDTKSDKYLPGSSDLPLQINIHGLYKHIYDPERFNEISVIIVDCHMPTMDGIDFCRKLIDSPIKKIMLTGEADESLAVQLFNEGIIDKFVLKGKSDLDEFLKQSIHEMQRKYFQDITEAMIEGISSDPHSSLGDPIFVEFFNELIEKFQPSSYYLLDPSGSYLFLDDNANPTWLIIKTQNELDDFVDQMQDMDISPNLIEKVKNGEMIPYFQNFDHYMDALENKTGIENYLLAAKKLEGRKVYSYAVVNSLFDFSLDKEKIISFQEFIMR